LVVSAPDDELFRMMKTIRPGRGYRPPRSRFIDENDGALRRDLLPLREAQIVIESRRRHYNSIPPHASLGYKPLAPESPHASRHCVVGYASNGSPGNAGAGPKSKLTFHYAVGAGQEFEFRVKD
jgi:hypothetical protein